MTLTPVLSFSYTDNLNLSNPLSFTSQLSKMRLQSTRNELAKQRATTVHFAFENLLSAAKINRIKSQPT